MKKYILIILLLGTFNCISQQWDWADNYNGQYAKEGKNIGEDKYGNLYVTGRHWYSTGGGANGGSFSYSMMFKYSAQGNLLWADTLAVGFNKAITDSEGNTFISNGSYLSKLDSSGALLWVKNYPNFYAFSICFYINGNLLLTGKYSLADSSTGFVSRHDGNGDLIWRNTGQKMGGSLIRSNKTGVINVIGSNFSPDISGNRAFFSQFDSLGNFIISKSIAHEVTDFECDEQNNLYVLGYIGILPVNINGTTYSSPNGGYDRLHLVKYDTQGNFLWLKLLKGKWLRADGKSLAVDKDKSIYITGSFEALQIDSINYNSGAQDLFVLKIIPNGEILWGKRSEFQGSQQGGIIPYGIVVNDKKEISITGQISMDHGFDSTLLQAGYYPDIFVAKLSQPNIVGIKHFNIANNKFDVYPNPTSGFLTIKSNNEFNPSASSGGELRIENVLGQLIFAKKIATNGTGINETIDLSRHPKGIYFVQINSGSGVETRKIVLE